MWAENALNRIHLSLTNLSSMDEKENILIYLKKITRMHYIFLFWVSFVFVFNLHYDG